MKHAILTCTVYLHEFYKPFCSLIYIANCDVIDTRLGPVILIKLHYTELNLSYDIYKKNRKLIVSAIML